ncbi:phage head closure protein [Shinella zoogloeoides]|uniref:phage head closure protein n=1 Tax=Shinella zoogloeoides TaxID=352475 RepID=UPI001F57FD67|nr:phage head closure protein [Shinella zoogloeoides]
MRAGKLDKTITIERRGEIVDDFGTVTEGWASLATVRAQVIQQGTEEFLQNAGTDAQTAIVFRIRRLSDLTTADRVSYGGRAFDVKEIKELGRRGGLDLRCVAGG